MSRIDACLALMDRDDIDVLVLGREANTRTITDAARLWLAGTRAYSPGCVVVRASRAVHLLANTDAVVPRDFPVARLYGLTWNPERLLAALTAVDGVSTARRVGVDGMTPGGAALLARAMPHAELVDAGPLFADLWRTVDPEKTTGVGHAASFAGVGLESMAAALIPGVWPRELRGICAEAFAAFGVTTPAYEAVAAPIDAGGSTWLPPDRPLSEGERVVLRSGALRDGWEASIARTFVVGVPAVEQPAPDGWDALVAACIPGTTAGALRQRGAAVNGSGRGVEPWPDDLVLVPGLMASVELRDEANIRQDVLHITDGPAYVLTESARHRLRR
ncbi:MAG TPA: M24 family metallopeptidase [Acidimicrobiia bacterium]|nr:M24 family metallopeptidase [Acidimicrobiia bacterium]